jgi:hypothetical protein
MSGGCRPDVGPASEQGLQRVAGSRVSAGRRNVAHCIGVSYRALPGAFIGGVAARVMGLVAGSGADPDSAAATGGASRAVLGYRLGLVQRCCTAVQRSTCGARR